MLVVGKILRPHGIRGELVVEVRTDEPEDRFAVGSAFDAGPTEQKRDTRLTIESIRWHQGRPLIFFAEVPDRHVAEELRGLYLWVDSAGIAAPADPDEFHDHQLVGLDVVTVAGDKVGVVDRIDHAPASDMLVVRKEDRTTALVPFVRAIVPTVDVAGGRVVIDPPGGLLDL
ncbi:ribosome maturation factor RimM [Hamadaea sp.]|uniref:ribosome maturation factor RimM n=1 Tax=Hamadaea sp. TaxID=2024425 RepID=UPI0025BD59FA|nr:ribosome maturation factor RimM [Hamadaea sp.]